MNSEEYLDEWQNYFKMYKPFQNDVSALITLHFISKSPGAQQWAASGYCVSSFLFFMIYWSFMWWLLSLPHIRPSLPWIIHPCGIRDCLAWPLAASRGPGHAGNILWSRPAERPPEAAVLCWALWSSYGSTGWWSWGWQEGARVRKRVCWCGGRTGSLEHRSDPFHGLKEDGDDANGFYSFHKYAEHEPKNAEEFQMLEDPGSEAQFTSSSAPSQQE